MALKLVLRLGHDARTTVVDMTMEWHHPTGERFQPPHGGPSGRDAEACSGFLWHPSGRLRGAGFPERSVARRRGWDCEAFFRKDDFGWAPSLGTSLCRPEHRYARAKFRRFRAGVPLWPFVVTVVV